MSTDAGLRVPYCNFGPPEAVGPKHLQVVFKIVDL